MAAALLAMASLAMAVSWMDPADSHSASTLLSQFLLETVISLRGRRVLGRLRRASSRLVSTQTSLLLAILKHNQHTSYGRRHRFADVLAASTTPAGRAPSYSQFTPPDTTQLFRRVDGVNQGRL